MFSKFLELLDRSNKGSGAAGLVHATIAPFTMLLISACPVPANAQERSTGAVEIGEVVVTATRREEAIVDVPVSVTSISGKELEARQAIEIKDFIQTVPGVTLNSSGPGGNEITIRGIRANPSGISSLQRTTTGYYVNDVPFSDNPQATGEVALFDMKGIEIARGPQGTLFGEGAPGGIVRFITNKPDLSGYSGQVAARFHDYSDGGSAWQTNAMFNVANSAGTFGARFVTSYRDDDGWLDALAGPDLVRLANKNANDNLSGRATFLFKPNDVFSAEVMWMHGETDANNSIGGVLPADPSVRTTALLNWSEQEYDLYNATLSWSLKNFDLISSSNYMDQNSFVYLGLLGPPVAQLQQEDQSITNFVQEVRAVSSGDGPVRWVAGAFYKDQKRELALPLDIVIVDSPTEYTLLFNGFFIGLDRQFTQAAVFGELEWDVSDRVTLTFGARYTDESIDYVTDQVDYAGFFFPTFTETGTTDYNDFTPKFSASFAINDDSNVYVTVAKGFRGPGLKNFYTGQSSVYGAEELWSYEAGYKAHFADRRGYLAIAAYYNDWTDMQIPTVPFAAPWASEITNAGKAKSTGLELETSFAVNDNWNIGATAGLIDSELSRYEVEPAYEGNELQLVPDLTWSAFVDAQYPLGSGKDIGFRVDYLSVGESYNDLTNDPSGRLSGYETLNARVGVSGNEKWELYLFGQNLTDEFIAYSGESVNGFVIYGPRRIGVGASFRFD